VNDYLVLNDDRVSIAELGVGDNFSSILTEFLNDENVIGYTNRSNLHDSTF
jgi:hypothetical protein